MRIFKNTWFSRFARKENITDEELRELVNQLEGGQAGSDLGGGVFKVRLARSGEGKSVGYRIIIFFKIGERSFFHYGFAKAARDNISKGELKVMKKQAKKHFAQSDEQIEKQLANGTLIEIT
ncbi:MAG: type II toxin-antitoxin system RelE/ParE family toxin [Treponema sp.]|nr:type II toxin-antitoxin system RelE/ParE family toxin [Treponema sp.]